MYGMNTVVLQKPEADGLKGVRWSFYLLDSVLVVDSYEEYERASKRHKPRTVKNWSRLNKRDSTMPQEDVPLTPEIMAEAKAQYLAELESKLSVGFQR